MPSDQTDRRQKRIADLRQKKAQIEQALKDAQARDRQQTRRDETARKIEAGALALNHMRENPASEFASIMVRLLNRYVPRHRRRLFSEFGLEELAPSEKGNDNEKPDAGLKDQFPG